jgi:hypothetical protein
VKAGIVDPTKVTAARCKTRLDLGLVAHYRSHRHRAAGEGENSSNAGGGMGGMGGMDY